MSHHKHDPEFRECQNDDCVKTYDLARQNYYGPKCPDCTEDERQ